MALSMYGNDFKVITSKMLARARQILLQNARNSDGKSSPAKSNKDNWKQFHSFQKQSLKRLPYLPRKMVMFEHLSGL